MFFKKNNISKLKYIIKKELNNKGILKGFLKYLENYIFKLNLIIYIYTDILELYFSNKNENSKYLDKRYLTNNICEGINSLINY